MSKQKKRHDSPKEKAITKEIISSQSSTSNVQSSNETEPTASTQIPQNPASFNKKANEKGKDLEASSDSSLPLNIPLSQYNQIEKEKEEFYQRLLRLQAEFENYRKRTEKERQSFYDYSLGNFLSKLLPIVDAFERGMIAPDGETIDSFKTGFQLVLKQFKEVLSKNGLKAINTVGKTFDPNLHEALMKEETDLIADNEIVSEIQRGYLLKDRVLRPSLVTVAVTPNDIKPSQSDSPSENSVKKQTSNCGLKENSKSNEEENPDKVE